MARLTAEKEKKKVTEQKKHKMRGPYPYMERYGAIHELPEKAFEKDDVFRQLREMAEEEDTSWQGGQCSGTMYGGDDEIFELIGKVFRM